MSPGFHAMTPASVHCFPPGAAIQNPQPGDFMLTHGVEWTDRLIRFGQRLRFRGADAPYAHWNHSALFVDAEGGIVEALAGGVARRNISLYASTEYTTFDDSATSAPTAVHVVGAGTVPSDGFSGYYSEGGFGVARLGDYAFAAVDGNDVWVANEYIPGLVQGADLANWGTFVTKVTP